MAEKATPSGEKIAPPFARPVEKAYYQKVESGEIEADPAQVSLVNLLDDKLQEIEEADLSSKKNPLGWLFNRSTPKTHIKGLYIWGSVGRGKSMLMDLFFAEVKKRTKLRSHFNSFMSDAQDRIHAQRQAYKEGISKAEDPIPPVGRSFAAESEVLCFDEFTVTDIADAMILGRLFKVMFDEGVIIIATSNVAPDNLYKDGLNRDLFLPFVEMLKARVDIIELDSRTDFRLEKLDQLPVYLSPLNQKNHQRMDEAWQQLTGKTNGKEAQLQVRGRTLAVPQAEGGVARFSFADLCEQPLGATDYLAIAEKYHTIMIDNVPIMDQAKRNEAKRFILLIDTLYDSHRRLVVSAATSPHALYQATTGTEAFEFERTASRLIEMQSRDYAAAIE